MDIEKLARRAQKIYQQRGGAEAAKGDATEVEGILHSEGSLVEKAKRVAQALKQPGAAQADSAAEAPSTRPTTGEGPERGAL